MCNDVMKLITQTHTTDSYGYDTVVETSREVFCHVQSVGMNEKYEALAIGLKPEYKFILEDYYEYEDEEWVEFELKRYRVLRTYRNGQTLEIVVTKEVSTT